jgi:2-aminoethylphosphonate-pyruvate transaminase
MLSDWGSWDSAFNELTASVCRDLAAIVDAQDDHVCVPLQGSGTFSVEAALGTLVPKGGKVLVPDNGSYCKRIVRILSYLGREAVVLPHAEDEPADPARIDAALTADTSISHVAQVHCETGTGILNPLPEIAAIVANHGRGLIVDAMSSYGAIPIDARTIRFDALIAASGKCLEGVPGMGFVIARRTTLQGSAGNSCSLAMDLLDQWQYMQKTGQWRFTPPPSTNTRRRVDRRPGWRATPRTAPRWYPACGRWASRHSCRTPCRLPSSSRFTLRPIPSTTSPTSIVGCAAADSFCIRVS